MKLVIGRIASAIMTAGGWTLFGIKSVLDLIGYSTAPDDAKVAAGLVEKFLAWVLSVPWWATLGFALATTFWLIWVSWPRPPKHDPAKAPAASGFLELESSGRSPKPAPAANSAPPEKKWPKTSDYDLPIKLGVIDELLEGVGSERHLEMLCRGGNAITRGWEHHIKKQGLESFISRLKEFQDDCRDVQEWINRVRNENEKYQDIWEILSPADDANPHRPAARFVEACKKMRPQPPPEFGYFLKAFADDLEAGVTGLGKWRSKTEKALLARRKELSG